MATLTISPQTVDVVGYAGDTLAIQITVPTAYIAGRKFTAQVRSVSDAALVDATFVVTPPAVQNGPVILTLSATITAQLVLASTRSTRTVSAGTYKGVWDVQLSPVAGVDPTVTLCRGTVTITGDVTRSP